MGFGIKRKFRKIARAITIAGGSFQDGTNLEREALLLCHALEKGMGVPNVKYGFGQEKATRLLKVVEEMECQGKECTYAFQESIAILKAYCEYQREEGVDLRKINGQVENFYEKYHKRLTGGYQLLTGDDFLVGTQIDFEKFIYSRHSMRSFSNEKLSSDLIMQAVRLAKKCPSACNRQPWKFYYSMKRDINVCIMESVPTQSFLADIPYFGVITVDREMFVDKEIYQWYINGGLFLAYLGLAFHHYGVGSCIFQFPLFTKETDRLKKRLNIPDSEEIIAIMGFGKYLEEAKCIYADRKADEEIAIEL